MEATSITSVQQLDFRLGDWKWPFAEVRRAEIASYFDLLKRKNDALWNGRVFLLRRYEASGDLLRGEFFETDFASLLAWRDWGFPDRSVHACFAMAAIQGGEGGFLLGVMGEHTANPGRAYFPTGSPDPMDLDGERVDLDRSVRRELEEETGLTFGQFRAEPGWHVVLAGQHLVLMKWLHARETTDELRESVLAFLATETRPEFSAIRAIQRSDGFTSMIPVYVQAFLREAWRTGEQR